MDDAPGKNLEASRLVKTSRKEGFKSERLEHRHGKEAEAEKMILA